MSLNPLWGSVEITYHPIQERAVEVVSLHAALAWACSRAPGTPSSAEQLAKWLADTVAEAVEVQVTVTLRLVLRPGFQRLVVRHRSR